MVAPLRFQFASNPIPTPTPTSDSTGASSDRMEVEARIACGCHSRWRSLEGEKFWERFGQQVHADSQIGHPSIDSDQATTYFTPLPYSVFASIFSY